MKRLACALVALAALPSACVSGVEGGPDAPEFGARPRVTPAGGAAGSGGSGGAGATAGSSSGGVGGSGGTAGAGASGGASGAGAVGGSGGASCDPSCASPSCADCDGNAANGCEQRLDDALHCGACGRTCGAATCNAAGACELEPVLTGGQVFALGGDASAIGVAFRRFSPSSSGIYAGTGATPTLLITVQALSDADRVVIAGPDVVFSSSTRVATIPVVGGLDTDVRNASQPRLAGATSSDVVVARPGSGNVLLERVSRATSNGVVHCRADYRDGALAADGRLYVAAASGLYRYDFTAAAAVCAGDQGVELAAGDLRRVAISGSRVYFVRGSGAAGDLVQLEVTGGPEVPLGVVLGSATASFALAPSGAGVLYAASGTGSDGATHTFVIERTATGVTRRLAVADAVPTALAVGAGALYVGSEANLSRVVAP